VRRLVALLVAVGLVVLAVVIRNGIDNGGGSGSGKLRLVCAPELEQPCRALGGDVEVTVEEPGATADRLEKASGDLGLDGWLTPGPWPEIVREARVSAGKDPLLMAGEPLAHSRVGFAVFPDRLEVLRKQCGPDVPWRCIGDVAGKKTWTAVGGPAAWGDVRFGIPDPSRDATGLAALGAATVGWFGKTDLSSADLDDSGFRTWLRGLASAQSDHPALDDVLARGPAEAGAAAGFEAVAAPAIATARNPKPVLTYPAPVARADVVLGNADTEQGRRLAELVRQAAPSALAKAGWQGANGLPSGLPSAGFLDALQDAWKAAANR
jgi:hypothetical protein